MKKHTSQSEATQVLAAGQTHNDMHPGHGVLAEPTHGEVARRAYEIYVNGGCKQGQPEQDWRQAEHELRTAHHRT